VDATAGDITGVTAGTGISGGGTSGTVTVSIDTAVTADLTTTQTLTNKTLTTPKISTYTTAGDLVYGTGSGVISRVGIGTAAQVLTVNSGATAPEWATASSGGMTLLSTTTLSGASTTVSSISQSYKDLYVQVSGATSTTAMKINFQLNGTTDQVWVGNYGYIGVGVNTFITDTLLNFTNGSSNNSANTYGITIRNYAQAVAGRAPISITGLYKDSATFENMAVNAGGARTTTTAISSITVSTTAGTFSAGTIYIYGVK
jgi:hypothetical protein